ncbi:MAG: response regulator [Actinobacteria bacterium]|nr:response regulator [Actinomycetota bacterium]
MNGGADILLVEDNPADVELTLRAFKKNRLSNKIHVARDGVEALEFLFAEDRPVDALSVVLLDVKMPRMDGLEVLQRIRADERTRHLPVVMMTSSSEESDRISSYDLGANSYIVKPVDFENFTEAVRVIGTYWLLLNKPSVVSERSVTV